MAEVADDPGADEEDGFGTYDAEVSVGPEVLYIECILFSIS